MPRSKQVSEQMRAESRAQIIVAARKLFAEQGYFNCKVSDIAGEAGMSQGNVYWYFKSKEDVLRAVLEEGFTAIGAIAQEVAALPGAGQDKLDALIERYLALYREQSEFPVILLSLMAHGGTPFLQTLGFDMLQIGTGYHQHMSGILAQARAEGIVADLEPDLLVVFFYAFFNGLMMTYRDMLPVIPPALIHAAVIRLLGGHVTR